MQISILMMMLGREREETARLVMTDEKTYEIVRRFFSMEFIGEEGIYVALWFEEAVFYHIYPDSYAGSAQKRISRQR